MTNMHITTCHAAARPAINSGVFDSILDSVKNIGSQLITWSRRHDERTRLRQLPDRLLQDMGVTRAEADQEAAKPFWKD